MLQQIAGLFKLLFSKWWVLLIVNTILFYLFFINYNGEFLFAGFIYSLIAFIYNLIHKKWISFSISYISLIINILFAFIVAAATAIFPIPNDVKKMYSARYENKDEIQSIVGIELPDFEVAGSELTHFNNFDFEFKVEAILKLKKSMSQKTFIFLDSICNLKIPNKIYNNSQYFFVGLEQIYPCWSKDSNSYTYSRNSDQKGNLLHHSNAYFSLTLYKNSDSALLVYGQY